MEWFQWFTRFLEISVLMLWKAKKFNVWKSYQIVKNKTYTLREKCPYLEFFCSVFSPIRTEYGETLCISPYSVRMWENTDQKNSEYGLFSLDWAILV